MKPQQPMKTDKEILENADFRIAYDGTWFHDGVRIQREALARLFSDRALSVDEEGRYWLSTPYENYPVEVEDVPYIIIDFEEHDDGYDLITNMGERVALGPDHPLELRADKVSGDQLPYVEVRAGLYARMGRPVYYSLAHSQGPVIRSRGMAFPLGVMDE